MQRPSAQVEHRFAEISREEFDGERQDRLILEQEVIFHELIPDALFLAEFRVRSQIGNF